ncbi:MAG: leucyl/phenylalanyl-tRNA--protein transferase [Myxococcales bacterium]|nr:leucyl/phenylalanyl-tRNA--protein transferase [Myxococcales bacterium]MCB9708638.1 leucyl/phenylalanyl-tRNA--protein transferase [Myxococcales bacterium]
MVSVLGPDLAFPSPESAGPLGIVAVGGTCTVERLILAYSQGIFPWPHEGLPLLWFSPDPRFVLDLNRTHVPRSLRKRIAQGRYTITADIAFAEVMRECAMVSRPNQDGTWITPELMEGYQALHQLGYAHSIEAWHGEELVGGLYGVALGRVFFGETMFAKQSDASKVAFVTLLGNLLAWNFTLVDCQTPTEHLARFGATLWRRSAFLLHVRQQVMGPTRRGPWRLDHAPQAALAELSGRSGEL